MNVANQSEFNDKYAETMLNGLSSTNTYIPLRTNKRLGINVAIRPMVFRAKDNVVVFGGKLRVGYTLDTNKNPIVSKVTALNPEAKVAQLKDFCKGWSWQKESHRRFSTVVGTGIAASRYDGERVREYIEESNIALEFLNKLERNYRKYNDDVGFMSKRQMAKILNDAWLLQSENSAIFVPAPDVVQLPEDVLGITSPVLNQAQESYSNNVVSFAEKVADLAAESKAEDDEESNDSE